MEFNLRSNQLMNAARNRLIEQRDNGVISQVQYQDAVIVLEDRFYDAMNRMYAEAGDHIANNEAGNPSAVINGVVVEDSVEMLMELLAINGVIQDRLNNL